MPEFRPRQLLIVLAALAIGLATCAALAARGFADARFPSYLSMGVIGIGLGWVGLGSVYLALGRQPLVVRLMIGTATALVGGAISASGEGTGDYANWCGVTLFGVFVISVPLIYLWARGLRITHPEHPPLVYWKPRRQFSLWGLLSAMTCVAVLLAVAVKLRFPIDSLYAVLVICGSTAFITYAVCGTLLNPTWGIWALVAIPVAVLLAGGWLDSVGPSSPVANDFGAAVSTAVVVTIWMLVQRIAGYRLHWPDYTAMETVGPSKRLEDEQGRPVEIAAAPASGKPS